MIKFPCKLLNLDELYDIILLVKEMSLKFISSGKRKINVREDIWNLSFLFFFSPLINFLNNYTIFGIHKKVVTLK